MNELETTAIGVIKKEGSQYCLHFSDGRKECFSSKQKAVERENQVKFFKHKDKSSTATMQYLMSSIGIVAEYDLTDDNAAIYLVSGMTGIHAFLVKGAGGDEVEIYILDKDHVDFEKYSPILSATLQEAKAAEMTSTMQLSEAIMEGQLLVGSHTHSVEIDSDGMGTSTEAEGHTHFVDTSVGYTYVASAPLEIAGIKLSHTHFPTVQVRG
jgi:hypothetical protein